MYIISLLLILLFMSAFISDCFAVFIFIDVFYLFIFFILFRSVFIFLPFFRLSNTVQDLRRVPHRNKNKNIKI